MVSKFEATNNRIVVIDNDKTEFDTAFPSLIRLPPSTHISLTGQTITFPSYLQRKAYYRNAGPASTTICELWSTLIWQEWGPDEENYTESNVAPDPNRGTSRNLPRIKLGDVPAETTYLDIRVKLTRVTAPPAQYGLEFPLLLFKEGEFITLPGGSLPVELVGAIGARELNIVRIGNEIYLERFQSVRNADTTLAPGGYAQANISTNQSGWNSNSFWSETSNGNLSDGADGRRIKSNFYLYSLLQRKGYDADGTKRPGGGTNTCSAPYQDLSTVLTGDIMIVPCIRR